MRLNEACALCIKAESLLTSTLVYELLVTPIADWDRLAKLAFAYKWRWVCHAHEGDIVVREGMVLGLWRAVGRLF